MLGTSRFDVAQSVKNNLEPIMRMLYSDDPVTKLNSLQALGRLGPPVKILTQRSVVNLLKDPDLSISIAAVTALVAQQAYETIPDLKNIVVHPTGSSALKLAAQDAIQFLEKSREKLANPSEKKEEKK